MLGQLCTEQKLQQKEQGKCNTTTNNFKLRYAIHKKSFLEVARRNDSGLAEQVWAWKETGLSPSIKFSVVCKQSEYNPLAKKCSLCIREKLHIMKALQDPNNLNHKKELMGHCLHRGKSLLSNINIIDYKHNKDSVGLILDKAVE